MNEPVAVVTGAGRGIGKAIAWRLSKEGFAIVLAGDEAEELQECASEFAVLECPHLVVQTDIRDEYQIRKLVDRTMQRFGRIDVLVNNAAVIGPTAPVAEIARADWEDVMAVNLTGAFLCSQAVLPTMKSQQSGRIINISSIAGKIAYALRSPYAVSKWGLIGFTLTLAKEVAKDNILVNAVCPGPVMGERMQRIFEQRAAETGKTPAEIEKEYLDTTLLGKMVDAEHVASLVGLLASEQGSSMTGQVLDITAGYGL